MFNAFIVAFCLFGGAYAQVFSQGSCSQVETMKDFSLIKFSGHWFEAAKYYVFFEMDAKCVMVDYTLKPNDTIKMVTTWNSHSSGAVSILDAMATVPNKTEPAKMKIRYPMMPIGSGSDYWVIGTDYNNYAIVYNCKEVTDSTSHKYAWILTREQFPSEEVLSTAFAEAEKNKLIKGKFETTDQTNCST